MRRGDTGTSRFTLQPEREHSTYVVAQSYAELEGEYSAYVEAQSYAELEGEHSTYVEVQSYAELEREHSAYVEAQSYAFSSWPPLQLPVLLQMQAVVLSFPATSVTAYLCMKTIAQQAACTTTQPITHL